MTADLPAFARGLPEGFAPVARPVTPRDAASLILVRRGSSEPEILLGRRAGKHRFLPNVYAFPGGRLDLSDKSYISSNKLENILNLKHVDPISHPILAPALGYAALRETFEETGLAIGKIQSGRLVPDLTGLVYLGRAITPPQSPIRFHARFFLQDMTDRDTAALGGSGELLDLAFRPVSEALRLPLADITEFMVSLVGRLPASLTPDRTAFWHYRGGKPVIRWENP